MTLLKCIMVRQLHDNMVQTPFSGWPRDKVASSNTAVFKKTKQKWNKRTKLPRARVQMKRPSEFALCKHRANSPASPARDQHAVERKAVRSEMLFNVGAFPVQNGFKMARDYRPKLRDNESGQCRGPDEWFCVCLLLLFLFVFVLFLFSPVATIGWDVGNNGGSTNKGANYSRTDVTGTPQQRPESS